MSEFVRIHAIGGFDGIGGSAALVNMDGVSILFDCGLRPNLRTSSFPKQLEKVKPDMIILSHAHIDHVGALPIVLRNNPGIAVYATIPTKFLAEIMLRDARKLSRMTGQELYKDSEIEFALDSIIPVNFGEEVKINNILIKFRRAGHILGAATVVVQGSHKIVYTGDFAIDGTLLTPMSDLPSGPEFCDLLLCETTYGGTNRQQREEEEKRLLKAISKILGWGGRVLIPCFALGRAQEILALLIRSIENRMTPRFRIYLDGLVRDVTLRYSLLSDWLANPLLGKALNDPKIITPITSMMKRIEVLFGDEPCVIIASSGMLNGGWSQIYARDICSRTDSAIFFVGYLDEDSPGAEIIELASGKVKLLDEDVPVKCKVESFDLSAHADHTGILAIAEAYRPRIFVPVHGEPDARWGVAKDVNRLFNSTILMPYDGSIYDVFAKKNEFQIVQTESETLAQAFFSKIGGDVSKLDARAVYTSLEQFLEEGHLTEYEQIQDVLFAIFTISRDFVSKNVWTTLSERAKFYHACIKFLSDWFPDQVDRFRSKFEKTIPSFLANLLLYGGNRSRLEPPYIRVENFEEAEALLVQVWNNFELDRPPNLLDIYHRCRIRTEWLAESQDQRRFSSIFSEMRTLIPLLEVFPRWVKFLVIEKVVLAAVKEQVITVLIPQSDCYIPDAEQYIERCITVLLENKLFKLTGWQLDRTKLRPAILCDTEKHGDLFVTRERFRAWLLNAIEPFRNELRDEARTMFVLSDLPVVLKEANFCFESNPQFIDAEHTISKKKILIAIDTSGKFSQYESIPGCVMDAETFKITIKRLDRVWKHKEDVKRQRLISYGEGMLATDVIASLGWHAYVSQEERRRALERAVEIYGLNHLIRLLRLLENYWKRNPSSAIQAYAPIAKTDREWLERTYGYKQRPSDVNFIEEVTRFCGLEFTKIQFDRYFVVKL